MYFRIVAIRTDGRIPLKWSLLSFKIFMFFVLKDKSQTAELWEKLNFGNKDQNVKFRKLMGIKVSSNPVLALHGNVLKTKHCKT